MRDAKKRSLERRGWRVGSARDFLGLSEEEAAFVEIKVALAGALRERRRRLGLSQIAVAGRLGSSQSRVAKMEAADPSVSLDLLLRALLALGASRQQIARVMGSAA